MSAPVAVAGTSALLALFNRQDTEHAACVKARAQISHLVISPLVLAELDCLVTGRIGQNAALAVLDHIMDRVDVKRYEVPELSPHLRTARALMVRHRTMNIGLTDAVNAAVARRRSRPPRSPVRPAVRNFHAARPDPTARPQVSAT
ncbi:type II toxin-antitoxin system VapC family toxin [Planomonospora corallina]|uniref:Ribonuclease VapC n=1 Tax=Planomonospora corallina TaxID=1806052 RepID=A0ABV8I952_9ACTN